MTRIVMPLEERPAFRNGVYPHQSFKARHRIQAMEMGGWVAVGLLMLGLSASGVALLAWAIHILWDLLVRHWWRV